MKSENLRSHCDCSGEYQMSETRQDLVKRLQVTSKVADFHNLQVLATAVEWMQELLHWCVQRSTSSRIAC